MKSGVIKFIILSIFFLHTSYGTASALMESERWREIYREKLSSKIFRKHAETILHNYKAESAEIEETVSIARSGDFRAALSQLLTMRGDVGKESLSEREAIYLSGLINEGLGFSPEALGHYTRVIRHPQKGIIYQRVLLRRSFILLQQGVNEENARLIEKAGKLFYRLYRSAERAEIWREALAGYAVALSLAGKHDDAEVVFGEIEGFMDANPPFRFFRAENYIKMGRPDIARERFLVLKSVKEYPLMAGYAILRVGDIEVETGEREEAERRYKELLEVSGERGGRIMGMMALAELHRGAKQHGEAVELLHRVLDEEVPYEVRDIALLYLVYAFEEKGNPKEVISNSRKLVLTGASTSWKGEARRILSDTLFSTVESAYSEEDYPEVIRIFYTHGPYIKEGRTRRLVADALLETNLPSEARKIYMGLGRGDNRGVPAKLIRTYIMEGEIERVEGDIRRNYAKKNSEINLVLLEAGNLYMRRGAYDQAMVKYGMANNKLDFPDLLLKYAQLYTVTGKPERATGILKQLIKRYPDGEIAGRAYVVMGDAYYAMERWSNALEVYRRGVKDTLPDDTARIRYRMGRLNLMAGKLEEAVTIWEGLAGEDSGYYGRLAGESLKEAALWSSIRM